MDLEVVHTHLSHTHSPRSCLEDRTKTNNGGSNINKAVMVSAISMKVSLCETDICILTDMRGGLQVLIPVCE